MSAPTSPPLSRRQKNRQIDCKVLLLDDTTLSVHIPVKSSGQVLYDEVIRKLQLLEADYFDLEYEDVRHARSWLDHDKPVLRQLPRHNLDLRFVVKFYTPDPGQLEEDYTRYLFALQVRRDLLSAALPCQEHTAVLLASYIVQAELGDFSDEFEVPGYLKDIRLLPKQTEELEQRIAEHHRDHTGQTPATAEFNLLDTARKVDLYGIQTHPAKDHEGVPLHLAVAHLGVLVFQNQTKINTFSWAKIRKLSFKRKKFLVKLHPEGYGYYKDIVEFYFESRNDCKNFWKKCLEHHAFFRCHSVKRLPRNKTRLLVSRGSSFRYCGRTQKQLAEYVRENCNRRPEFQRSTSMRTISLSHSVATTPKTGTLKSRAEHHLSHPNIRSSGSSHALCLERAHARERYKHAGRSDTAPSRSLHTFREPTRQALTPPGVTKKSGDELSKNVRRARMELRNGTLDDFNLSYFKSGYSSDNKQSRDAAYHDNMSQDSYQLTESHDSLDFDRVEPGAVDGNELCRQLEGTMEGGEQVEVENREEGTVRTAEESENATFVESGDAAMMKSVKDGETVGDLGLTEEGGEIIVGDGGTTVGEDGVEDQEELSVTEAVANVSLLRRKRLSRGEAVGVCDEDTASPGHEAKSSPGHEVISSPGHRVVSSPGHEVTIAPGREVTSSPGYEVKSSPGHEVKSSPGHEVKSSPGHLVTISPIHSGVDVKDGDAHEPAIDSSENVTDTKSFQRTSETTDVQRNASTGHEISSSPGHKVTSSPGHKVTSSPGHKVEGSPSHESHENLDKSRKLETTIDSVRIISEAESHESSHQADLESLGKEVITSPGQVTVTSLGEMTNLEKSEVGAEQKTGLECSTDTLQPSGAGSSFEQLDEQSKLDISEATITGREEKPESSTDLEVLGNGQDETRDQKVENDGNKEDALVVPRTGENPITSVDTEFPYILHKRHLASKGEQTDIAVPNASSLALRRFRSRSPSPGNKKPTREEQKAELEKVKATLSSLAFPRKDDPSMEKRRILDFVVYSRLPPRDSFSSKDDSISPTTLERALVSKGSKGKADGGSKRLTKEKPRIGKDEQLAQERSEGDSIREISTIKDNKVENRVESVNKRTLGQSLDSRTRGRYNTNDGAVGGSLTDLGAGESVLDAYLDVEASSSLEQYPDEFGSGLYIAEDSGFRTSFPPNVVGVSMCSLEEFMLDVDLPAPIVESEEFDTSTSNSGGEVSVLEQSGRDEDVSSLEREALEERLAQVVLPPPPPPLLEGVWSDDDALNMELLEPPEMLELFLDDDDVVGTVGVELSSLNANYCDSVDLFDEVSSDNLKRFGADGGGSVGGSRFTVEDLAVFNALHTTTNDFSMVTTSSPIPSPPPPPFPWCDDDAQSSTNPRLSPSQPMVEKVENGTLVRTLSSSVECNMELDTTVHKIIEIECSQVVSTSTSGGNLPTGKDPLESVENNPGIDSTMLLLSTTKLHQPPNLLSNDDRASSSQIKLEDDQQLCSSTLTIPSVLCSLEPGLASETTRGLLDVASGQDFLSARAFSDHGDISDEDEVEKPYTEHSLHDLYRNLEAEAHAKPFHVPISTDIPLEVFHSEDNVSLSRFPDSSDEITTDSLCITELVSGSIVDPLFGESHVDDDNVVDQESLQHPSQTVSLQSIGSSSNSQCSSNTKPS